MASLCVALNLQQKLFLLRKNRFMYANVAQKLTSSVCTVKLRWPLLQCIVTCDLVKSWTVRGFKAQRAPHFYGDKTPKSGFKFSLYLLKNTDSIHSVDLSVMLSHNKKKKM